jgi:protein-S-isoprenylcysteine O-methyltransferase Ste14
MKNKTLDLAVKDHPGVYIPPPLLYVAVFLLSILLQRSFPIESALLKQDGARYAAWTLVALHLVFIIPAFWRFFASKNSLIPIKPASTLQTAGIYAITRNPMYLGLLIFYFAMAIFKGNWWTFIVSPLIITTMQFYVIRKEEQYLQRRFHQQFEAYCKTARRWI